VIGSECPNQKKKPIESYIASKHAFMDGRFAKLPAFMGGQSVSIPSLTGGFYAKKRAEVSSIFFVINIAMIINIIIGMAFKCLAIFDIVRGW
jgi:hypothetical protein